MRRRLVMLALASTAMTSLSTNAAAQEAASEAGDNGVIIVTAQRREENLQDVPASVVALTNETLENLQVRNFVDYIAYLPSASFTTGSTGVPGNTSISFRGITTGGGLVTSGTLPTVGSYLDEQPITSILGTVDIHVYDIARVEALAGPQGTLYGASSQAGVVRIITNKPDPDAFSARMDLEVNRIRNGDWGGQIEGFVNLPVLDGRGALRLVGWYERTGGFIDNVLGVRTFATSRITQRNDALVEEDHNPVDKIGLRAQLGIELDDNWTVTPSVIAQRTEWQGSFQSDDDNAGELNVAHYYPEFGEDEWYQAGLTINGRISDFDIVYAGYYMDRRVDTQNDYSDYGFFYDLVAGSGAGVVDNAGRLIDPSQINTNRFRLNKLSQELRISTPQDKRIRGQFGLFYQRQFQRDENNYLTPGFADRLSVPGRPGQVWLTLQDRIDRDYAAFAQADFDVTDKLLLTGGVRAYKFDNSLVGFFGVNTTFFGTGVRQCLGRAQGGGPFGVGIAVVPGSPCTNLGVLNADGSISPKRSKGDGFTYRANATYRFTPDNLVFATFSTGFRPGGINRAGTAEPFDADELQNYEIGTKNTFADGRLTLNVTAFLADWKDVQVTFQPPGGSGVVLIGNVGSARSKGIEADIAWRPLDGFTLTAAGTYIDASLREPFILFGRETAPAGQRLPLTPRFKGNVIARYEAGVGDGTAHLQLAGAYIGQRNPVITTSDLAKTGVLPEYATLDFSVGYRWDDWEIEVYGRNMTDARGQQSRAARCNINICGPSTADPVGQVYRIYIQPATMGLRIGRKF
ncbi:MAG: TonB-denpendent receptor [Blastomonas sp. CACIA14H2]|nr:MAG: TonB-denpendent receptor [Blastomonas sp. CACIA14H2]